MNDTSSVVINGKPLVCPHCGGTAFDQRNAQLNTAGMTFFNMDWMNKSATVFHCLGCGRLEWFLDPSYERGSDPASEIAGTPWQSNPGHTTS
jgi:hypothetical protein